MPDETQQRYALMIVAAIAILAAAYIAQPILAPLALAFVTSIVLSPIQAGIRRVGLPQGPSAVVTFIAVFIFIAFGALLIEPFISQLYVRMPAFRYELRQALEGVRDALGGLAAFSDEMGDAISPENANGAAGGTDDDAKAVTMPSLTDALFLAPAIAAQAMVFVGGLFFFLLCREDVYRWTATAAGASSVAFRTADRLVARYFIAISCINAGFGVIVAIALHLIGVPNAPLWGAIAAVINFVLYLGPALFAGVLIGVGVIMFDGLYSVMPAAAFIGLNMMEGQFVTPTIVGRHMSVNPLLIFLSLVLLLWLWGPIGGIVAIPLLLWVQAVVSGLGLTNPAPRATFIQGT